MNINVETVPHEHQRYPTVGDYWEEGGKVQVRVSEMRDWRYEILVAVHEIVEWALTKQRDISEHDITEFDIAFEKSREQRLVIGEPGDHAQAPYRKEHFFATHLERSFAAELGVEWHEYDRYVDEMGIKR